MKKAYSKPEISFESFQMSTSIANDCGVIANQGDIINCEIYENGVAIFATGSDGNGDCSIDTYDCYHVSPESANVFGS